MRLVSLVVLVLCFASFTACYAKDNQPLDVNKLAQFLPAPLEGWTITPADPDNPFLRNKLVLPYCVDRDYSTRKANQYGFGESLSVAISDLDMMDVLGSLRQTFNNPKPQFIKTNIKGFPALEVDEVFGEPGIVRSLIVHIKNRIEVNIATRCSMDSQDIARAQGYLYSWADKIDYQGLADLVR